MRLAASMRESTGNCSGVRGCDRKYNLSSRPDTDRTPEIINFICSVLNTT
jgi:hypothetical protein